MADLSKITGDEPTFPCESCGKPKARVWVPLEGGNMTLGWACHWCLDPRTVALRSELARAEIAAVDLAKQGDVFTCRHCGRKVDFLKPYHSDERGLWHWDCVRAGSGPLPVAETHGQCGEWPTRSKSDPERGRRMLESIKLKPRTTVKRFAWDLKARIERAAAGFDLPGQEGYVAGMRYVLGIVDAALSDYDVRDPGDMKG